MRYFLLFAFLLSACGRDLTLITEPSFDPSLSGVSCAYQQISESDPQQLCTTDTGVNLAGAFIATVKLVEDDGLPSDDRSVTLDISSSGGVTSFACGITDAAGDLKCCVATVPTGSSSASITVSIKEPTEKLESSSCSSP